MIIFENLQDAQEYARESGESLYFWLDELRWECGSDDEFKKELSKHFKDATGVFEFWESNYDEYSYYYERY